MQPTDIGRLAIYYETEAYSASGQRLMGRQAAGNSFLKAVVNTQPKDLWCYARAQRTAQAFIDEVRGLGGGPGTAIHWISFLQPAELAKVGLLYRPDPGIAYDAWRRLTHSDPRAYSLCGVTHTTATHAIMDCFNELLTAPLEEWDAIICTSRAVRDSLQSVVGNAAEYLRERLGATRLTLPQLPVIPLGVHCNDFASTSDQHALARRGLGIGSDEIVVLFVGRLSFHGKAHPIPMYLALEACAKEAPITLVQAGWFANDDIERAFKNDAQKLCPSVCCLYVDGRDANKRRQAWAAADIFTSLSDNIQETYGLAPVEGMAAGLPLVVTDWNGYRDTVRDGVDGFRVPTLSMPPGTGGMLADRYDLNMDSYDFYTGTAGQLAAVDVEATAAAYRKLIQSRELRRRMGEAARQHARTKFDWSVVMNQYAELWGRLAELRRSSPTLHPPLRRRRRPDRADPFTMFATYPTYVIDDSITFRRTPGVDLESAMARQALETAKIADRVLPSGEVIKLLLSQMNEGERLTVPDVLSRVPKLSRMMAWRSLIWLSKMGLLTFGKPQKDNNAPSGSR